MAIRLIENLTSIHKTNGNITYNSSYSSHKMPLKRIIMWKTSSPIYAFLFILDVIRQSDMNVTGSSASLIRLDM